MITLVAFRISHYSLPSRRKISEQWKNGDSGRSAKTKKTNRAEMKNKT
jgi:hypothetical protein